MTNFYKNMLSLEVWHDFFLAPDKPWAIPNLLSFWWKWFSQLQDEEPPNLELLDWWFISLVVSLVDNLTPSQVNLTDQYDISALLSLVPTSDCEQILRKLRWFFRPMAFGGALIAYANQIEPGVFEPQIPITRPERLTFWLVVQDAYFANFTNLSLKAKRNQIYYFSNIHGNWQEDTLFLTSSLLPYQAEEEYQLGDLVVSPQGQTLEALQYISSAPASPNPDHWQVCPHNPYVSASDLLSRQGLSYSYTLPNLGPGDTVKFTLVDANGQTTFEAEVVAPKEHIPGDALVGSLNFTGQRPGCYRLCQDGQPLETFVLADPLVANAAFGLVELVLNPNPGTPGVELTQIKAHHPLQAANQIYRIRFKNRSTWWRYRHQTDHGFCLPDAPPRPPDKPACVPIDERFVVIDSKTYVTKRPWGLLEQPQKLLNNGKRVLPAPHKGLIKPIVEPAKSPLPEHVATIFSDVHI